MAKPAWQAVKLAAKVTATVVFGRLVWDASRLNLHLHVAGSSSCRRTMEKATCYFTVSSVLPELKKRLLAMATISCWELSPFSLLRQ